MADHDLPPWYVEEQKRLHQLQRDCWGYHAADAKPYALCVTCLQQLLSRIAKAERDRAASLAEAKGQAALAAQIRLLP